MELGGEVGDLGAEGLEFGLEGGNLAGEGGVEVLVFEVPRGAAGRMQSCPTRRCGMRVRLGERGALRGDWGWGDVEGFEVGVEREGVGLCV